MGKQLRFIITENNFELLFKEIEKVSKENDLIMYNIADKRIFNGDLINKKKDTSIYLYEKNKMMYIIKHIESGDIDGLYENGLEVDLSLSSEIKLYEYNRLWIDQSQYVDKETTLYKVYQSLVYFIKKNSLGYNKQSTEWMFFEDEYFQTYKKLRKNL